MRQIRCSKAIASLYRTHSRGYSANLATTGTVKLSAGWRQIGINRAYFRSRWEANYSRYLEFLKNQGSIAGWQHEPVTFWFEGIKRGCVSYLPDFQVQHSDGAIEYHEVKGWLDPKSKTKIKRMAKYYPDVKLIVVGKQEYSAIARSIGRFITGWE